MTPPEAFRSLPFSPTKTVSWIHLGDTHLTRAGEQNEIDLGMIVDEINRVFSNGGVDFVYVPGDIADDGSTVAYGEFRKHLDRLRLPWCAIVGDHDVQEKSFNNFRKAVNADLYSAFSVGPYRFLRLNAFSIPKPDAFVVDQEQLDWFESELKTTALSDQKAVVLLHCYPSDLKQGGTELTSLLRQYPVLLVDMGHTHYNEISNDGAVLYSATRSTGQIEEGKVGYSVITLDGSGVSWHFVELGNPSLVAITKPVDQQLVTKQTDDEFVHRKFEVHAKIWSVVQVTSVTAFIGSEFSPLESEDGKFWRGEFDTRVLEGPTTQLTVTAKDETGFFFSSSIRLELKKDKGRQYAARDQDNAIGTWEERGILGTQLGPNKNGRKW